MYYVWQWEAVVYLFYGLSFEDTQVYDELIFQSFIKYAINIWSFIFFWWIVVVRKWEHEESNLIKNENIINLSTMSSLFPHVVIEDF